MKTLIVILSLLLACAARGDWAITVDTLDGSGGSSSGAGWSLTGTIGQFDAGDAHESTNTVWRSQGGFWPCLANYIHAIPLYIEGLDSDYIRLIWKQTAVGHKLYYSEDLQVWQPVPNEFLQDALITEPGEGAWPLAGKPICFFRLYDD